MCFNQCQCDTGPGRRFPVHSQDCGGAGLLHCRRKTAAKPPLNRSNPATADKVAIVHTFCVVLLSYQEHYQGMADSSVVEREAESGIEISGFESRAANQILFAHRLPMPQPRIFPQR